MKTLYFDTKRGVSGDMVLGALTGLTDDPSAIQNRIDDISSRIAGITGHSEDGHHHDHGHFHRSYSEVLKIIDDLQLDENAEKIAKAIYAVIAAAESKVHGSPLDDLHFHEVGRDQAIANIAGVALCIDTIEPDRIIYDVICDGTGTVQCAHGTLSVPVPAVKAILDEYDINYRQTDYEGEMVTPSGLAMVVGIGAVSGNEPEGEPIRCSEAVGARSVDGEGLKVYIYELRGIKYGYGQTPL